MGVTDKYYKEALIDFLDACGCKELTLSEGIDSLENKVLSYKKSMIDREFYYIAGMTHAYMLQKTVQNNRGDLNACIGGLYSFEILIGVSEE